MDEIKKRVYLLLDPVEGSTKWDRIFNIFIVSLIIANTIAVILETVDSIYNSYSGFFRNFEIFSVIIFSVEYLLRIWSITAKPEFSHPAKGRLRFIFSFEALIDLGAVIPFYLPLITTIDLRFVRILRLIRFFRFFKLNRYLKASKIIVNVFKEKKEELILSMVITFFLVIIASSIMYFVEHSVQPDKFSSIPETMWWSVATLTTVGYGDVYPITTPGKTLTSIISILGIGMFALPAGILASGFSEALKKHRKAQYCPHCGKEINQ